MVESVDIGSTQAGSNPVTTSFLPSRASILLGFFLLFFPSRRSFYAYVNVLQDQYVFGYLAYPCERAIGRMDLRMSDRAVLVVASATPILLYLAAMTWVEFL